MLLDKDDNEMNSLSEINITPFVDVLLVLLIIFMVSAPLIQTGISINLPRSKTSDKTGQEEKVILSITKKKQLYVNKTKTALETLGKKLEVMYKKRKDHSLYIRADKNIPYNLVIQVMDVAKQSGILKIGMITNKKR